MMTDTVATGEMKIVARWELTFAVSDRSHREVGIAVAKLAPIVFPAQLFSYRIVTADLAGLHPSMPQSNS